VQVPPWLSRDRLAVVAALVAPLALTVILVPFRTSFPNTDAALALVLVVVAVAMNGYRLAGYLAALSAAVWFDFFLTRPYETFNITRRADIETTVLLLVIGVVVTELAVWARREHAAASRRAGYLDGINAAAHAVAAGSSPSGLIEQVSSRLTELLSLRTCTFQYGRAGLGRPARLRNDGGPARRHRHRTAGGKPRRPPGQVLDEGQPRCVSHPRAEAGRDRTRRPGRRRPDRQSPGRPLTAARHGGTARLIRGGQAPPHGVC
jgi:K+-sensing histidine kinase KdpD